MMINKNFAWFLKNAFQTKKTYMKVHKIDKSHQVTGTGGSKERRSLNILVLFEYFGFIVIVRSSFIPNQ